MAYLEGKGFKPAFHWQDVWAEEHAHAFTVAKAIDMDVLSALRSEVERAVRDGIPFKEFAATLEPRLQELGWWGKKRQVDPATGEEKIVQLGSPRRLKTIYWANTRSAYAAGQWERAQRTKMALPYFVYELGPSENHRPDHQAWANRPTILPVDHEFWDTHFCPNGWGCKCRLRQISRFEAEGLGGATSAPEIVWKDFTNKRSGEVTRVPQGVDPGWHTNPGKTRAKTLMRSFTDRLAVSPEPIVKQAIADLWQSRLPEAYSKMVERVDIPVAIAPAVAEQLGATGSLVSVSNYAISAKSAKHASVDIESFAQVQEIIDQGELIQRREGVQMWKQIDGKWWVAAVRKTGAGFARLVTLFTSSDSRRESVKRVEKDLGK